MTDDTAAPVIIGITSPLEPEYVDQIRAVAPDRVEVRYDPSLLPPTRYVADHHGPDDWRRPPEDQTRWEAMLADCQVLWDVHDVVLTGDDSPKPTVLDLVPNLRWIQTTSAGVGPMIGRLGLADTDIVVTTASGVHAGPLAEFVFAVLLTWVKELPRLREDQRAHRWERYCGGELAGSTITIVGPGRIGREVGRIARAFGMRTIGIGTRGDSARSTELGFDEYAGRAGLHAALARSDAVVLATPHTPDTEDLVDADAIAAMKPGICLVNIARGAVIDEDAMIAALQDGRIGFAGLDVFRTEPLPADSPLWDLPNVIIAPHSASTTWRENQRITDIFTSNLRHFLDGRFDQMQPVLDKRRGY